MLSHAIGTDPSAMAEHTPFDITYDERPLHNGFEGAVHHCLGRCVARTDMSVALLAQRMPDVASDGPSEWRPVSSNMGPVQFPLRFTPA